ncbi:hypothetical protein GALMADRAFT_245485 [Galerina marginata CBS 339.88]|uniref:Uncharacterized protein n=1 Tax=Galerina marginata (strain CBS 339.88) TaxID=685588 RepID=A0A067T5E2_GALM3|nr:hypothetical protein GALMADRAFT_245485 [Galerina marginata CBS 339.88]
MNDWTSLFLAFTFLLAGCCNFATVRQLRLRDKWAKEVLLPVYRPPTDWQDSGMMDEKMKAVISEYDLLPGNEISISSGFMVEVEEEEGRSFAVFSPFCAKRMTG